MDKGVEPAMSSVFWGFASLAVAGVALAVIAVPTVVWTRRGVRAVVRSLGRRRRADVEDNAEPATEAEIPVIRVRVHASTQEPAVPALGHVPGALVPRVVMDVLATHELSGLTSDLAEDAARTTVGDALTSPGAMPEELCAEIRERVERALRTGRMEQMPATVTPREEALERALTQALERAQSERRIPDRVLAEWSAGPLVMPGHYPLADGLLTAREVAELMARRGDTSWRGSLVIGAGPFDPWGNAWN